MCGHKGFEIILQDASAWTPATSLPQKMYGLRTVSINNAVIATGPVREFSNSDIDIQLQGVQ